MPLYMDRHNTVGATREVIAAAHEKDLAIQGKYGVRFITDWCDEDRSKAFCLVDAPNKEALQKTMTKPTEASPTRSSSIGGRGVRPLARVATTTHEGE
jgi:hypothetical protein